MYPPSYSAYSVILSLKKPQVSLTSLPLSPVFLDERFAMAIVMGLILMSQAVAVPYPSPIHFVHKVQSSEKLFPSL